MDPHRPIPQTELPRSPGRPQELFADLFSNGWDTPRETARPAASAASGSPWADPPRRSAMLGVPVPNAPRCPVTLADSGLTLMTVADLVLKHLHLQAQMLGVELARQIRLPFQIVEEALRYLKDERCIEVVSGDLIGPASYRFNLTDFGRRRAHMAFEDCRYVGPAPVPLSAYVEQCRRQTVAGIDCDPVSLREAFSNLIIRDGLLEELGPAVCSGRSIFVYGPPGNGKTMIAKGLGRFLNDNGGEIFVPYAVEAEGSVVTLFDPTIHQPTDTADSRLEDAASAAQTLTSGDPARMPDFRWRRVRRPVVITGGELTLDMLDLRYNRDSNFYTAPLHIKANSGVFLIDDFGRQIVSPRDLLNRWILPLEDRVDFLTMATGKKLAIPFEQLIIFSTNLDPRELVDEAFLRRIRHKIQIGPPSRDLFTEIFRLCCQQRDIPFENSAVEYLYKTYYSQGKTPRSSDPRDLLEIVGAICRYRHQDVRLTERLMAEATERFFCQI